MDIVIPLGKQSPYQNKELRYCLRLIEKHLKNYRNIYIVGELPNWLTNVIHIPASDTSSHEVNIKNKILIACEHPDISEDFIFFNDDHFLIKDVDALTYPYYYCDDLHRKVIGAMYRQSCNNTRNILEHNNLPILHYDIHAPIIYNKSMFKKIMEAYDWNVRSGYIIKSLYCNTLKVMGEVMTDLKVNTPVDQFALQSSLIGRHVFSCGDSGFPSCDKYLNEITKKSKYEI